MEGKPIEGLTQLVIIANDGPKKGKELHILCRIDDWSVVERSEDQKSLKQHLDETLPADEMLLLANVLNSSDEKFEIVREVQAFFKTSGAKVVRISKSQKGKAAVETVGYEVESRD